MAITESIRIAMQALENECAAATTLARAFREAASNDEDHEPAWISQFQSSIDELAECADALICAINRSQQ